MTAKVNMDVYSGDETPELEISLKDDCEGYTYLNLEEAKELMEELKKKIDLLESLK